VKALAVQLDLSPYNSPESSFERLWIQVTANNFGFPEPPPEVLFPFRKRLAAYVYSTEWKALCAEPKWLTGTALAGQHTASFVVEAAPTKTTRLPSYQETGIFFSSNPALPRELETSAPCYPGLGVVVAPAMVRFGYSIGKGVDHPAQLSTNAAIQSNPAGKGSISIVVQSWQD
jgi:hypothetical protein